MALLRNLSIKGKIISTLLFVTALGLVVDLSGISFLNSANNRMTGLISIDFEKSKLADRINVDLLEIHRSQKNLILATAFDQVGRFKSRLSQKRADLLLALASLDRLATKEEREQIKRLSALFEDFLKINDQIISLVDYDWENFGDPSSPDFAGSTLNKKAIALSTGPARATYDSASDAISEISKETEASMAQTNAESQHYAQTALVMMIGISALSIAIGLVLGLSIARSISTNINSLVSVTSAIAGGELGTRVEVNSRDETGVLASSIAIMQTALFKARAASQERDWLKTGIARINDVMRGKNHVFDLCQNALSETASYAGAHVGAIFLSDGDGSEPVLKLASGYAYSNATNFPDRFRLGEGLVGQVAAEKKQLVVKEVPKDYVKVCSGLGDACPDCITITPLIFDENVIGVLELGFIRPPSELQMSYLEQIIPSISVNLETVKGREGLAKALAHSQALHEELQQQQEELRAANEELEEQTEELKTSQDKLRLQQEEMEAINKELQEKNQHLDQQKKAIEQTNLELEQSQQEIAEKAEKLAQANKYKSDFLANVSHELRTPLNSMLLLSRMLSSNVEANLTDEQVRSAEIIHSSGKDLLSLINDILDLSRIEAGRMNISLEDVPATELGSAILNQFKPLADDKGLGLSIAMEAGCPEVIRTDRKRLDQILRNLVSNAIKFTEKGIININFRHALREDTYGREELLAIAVADTGVGIPPDKHALVFEAFQQLEGGETRKYGGTGLGLSISRELAHLLGGQIHLDSEQGIGSTFTLILPVQAKAPAVPVVPETASQRIEHLERTPACASPSQDARAVEDDRADIGPDDKTILIVEDDLNFAELLIKLCREKGFKCLAAMNGDEGVTMAAHYSPKGIILDLRLPGKDGWTVLSDLKDKPGTRHIPVYIMSIDDAGMEAFRKGAIGFLTKPANEEDISDALHRLEDVFSRPVKKLLIIEDDRNLSESIRILIGSGDVHVDQEATAKAAIEAIRSKAYDCMILDLGLPDMNGLEMLEKLSAETELVIPPVIVYTGRELTPEEEMELRRYSDSIIVKGVKSEERLLDEACLFLHCIVEKMPARKRQIITDLHSSDTIFKDKQVLIVDDDMRNVFALSSALEARGMKTIKAENGKRALDILDANPEIDLILLDIMMPVMDGYETMQHIRAHEKYGKVPILALTAKAMKQDRERCIASGASDYLSKPVDLDRLFSMMRVWLYR